MPALVGSSLTLSIAAPRDMHDIVLRDGITPIVRELASSSALDATYFERINKPTWSVRLRVLGARDWLEGSARGVIERRLGTLDVAFEVVHDDAEDKWVGGPEDEVYLKNIHYSDTVACLDLLEIEASGALGTSRAQWSLLVVERLLGLFGFEGDERLEFYRRGFQWAADLGRWDQEVFAALERKYEIQQEAIRDALALCATDPAPDAWGGSEPARIAIELLGSLREPIAALLAAAAAGRIARTPVDLAVLVSHAHSNRLGIHATQEATIRYLVWRARRDRKSSAP